MKEVEELLSTRAEIIALDATDRKRPGGVHTKVLVDRIREEGRLAMADCSTFEECRAAQEMGFDIVSTTLSGYTVYSPKQEGPDFELIRRCAEELSVPVIAEGRIHYPEDLRKAFAPDKMSFDEFMASKGVKFEDIFKFKPDEAEATEDVEEEQVEEKEEPEFVSFPEFLKMFGFDGGNVKKVESEDFEKAFSLIKSSVLDVDRIEMEKWEKEYVA
jgi:imidazole glycerol phosphate synthase subunit HisF